MSVNEGAIPAAGIVDSDVAQLHQLGYAQELRRRMGGFSNFAVSFTIISVLSGCLTLLLLRDVDWRTGRHRLGLDHRRLHDD